MEKAKQNGSPIFLLCLRRKRERAERVVSSLWNAHERRSVGKAMGCKRGVEE